MLFRTSLLLALWFLPAEATFAALACEEHCAKLAADGELRPGVSKAACVNQVCQQEAARLYQDAKYEESWEILDFLGSRLSRRASYQLQRGLTLYALGRFEDALLAFDIALTKEPESIALGAQRAHTLMRLAKLSEARTAFESLLENPKSDSEFRNLRTRSYLYGNIGIIQIMQGDLEAAEASLARAVEIDGRNRLADTYRRHVLPAIRAGELSTQAVGEFVVAFEELGLKRYDVAAVKLEDLLTRWPRFKIGYRRLAEIYRGYRRYEACESLLRLAEKNLPDDVEIQAERIRCSLLRHGPENPEARPHIAEIRALAKQHPKNQLIRDILTVLDL